MAIYEEKQLMLFEGPRNAVVERYLVEYQG
jgi:hypothetical protein